MFCTMFWVPPTTVEAGLIVMHSKAYLGRGTLKAGPIYVPWIEVELPDGRFFIALDSNSIEPPTQSLKNVLFYELVRV